MSRPHRLRFSNKTLLTLSIAAFLAAGVTAWHFVGSPKSAAHKSFRRFSVHRERLDLTVRASGKVDSSKKTLIECELENLSYTVQSGSSITTGGRSRILDIIPDGTTVHRDDVLCRLDSSDYEELVRQQAVKLEQARNDFMKAQLDVKAAEIALVEYRDGLLPESVQRLDSTVVMAQSEIKRQTDRLAWAEKMLKKGYIAGGQMIAERQRMLAAEISLQKVLGQKATLLRFNAPVAITNLEMRLKSLKTTLDFQELRLHRNEEMLKKFRRQVELCTIKAPHDGFVIYANEPDGDPRVQAGANVYQKMDLFYLPDLQQMEVQAALHETVISRVEEGMNVRVRVESLPQYEFEGHVVSVAPLPWVRRDIPFDTGVKQYMSKIRLHSAPEGVLPGMTAEVVIHAGHAENALVVPTRSVVVEQGRDFCYVAGGSGLERREVTLGQSTRDLLEIREGLVEGEDVVEDVSALDEEAKKFAVVCNLVKTEPADRNTD